MGLIANVSDDSIQLIGYTETVSYMKDTTTYEYYIRSTMSMCESVEDQAPSSSWSRQYSQRKSARSANETSVALPWLLYPVLGGAGWGPPRWLRVVG